MGSLTFTLILHIHIIVVCVAWSGHKHIKTHTQGVCGIAWVAPPLVRLVFNSLQERTAVTADGGGTS
eukprot:4106520-Prorocentrum_lima.AAC.1